ncbi:hypothetical protein N0V83_010914 [Neocucurbitaria cava]|uniref:Uncharacterized protein n=1 Tax=Neocucurbitaria cava TaxID=798079 RepID=A0A9W8XXG0_9PLEO|nr:hypothetical protein N0V83_010914 [Neocucurbitaria cava]
MWMGTLNTRSYRANPVRRDAVFDNLQGMRSTILPRRRVVQRQLGGGGSGLKIGGLTLGGPSGGISGNGLQLGGSQQQQAGQEKGNSTAASGEQTPAAQTDRPFVLEGEQPSAATEAETALTQDIGAGAGTENQPGRAEGEAAQLEAHQEAQVAQGEKVTGVKATEESELFSEEAGITLDKTGNAQNLGGNLGITKGTDGSTSVGGENGIQVASSGEATVAGNE